MKNNPFKDLYIGRLYPVKGHSDFYMKELSLLGEDAPNDIFNNWIDDLRTEYGYFKAAISKKHKIIKTKYGCLIAENNGWMYLGKAKSILDSIDKFGLAIKEKNKGEYR